MPPFPTAEIESRVLIQPGMIIHFNGIKNGVMLLEGGGTGKFLTSFLTSILDTDHCDAAQLYEMPTL